MPNTSPAAANDKRFDLLYSVAAMNAPIMLPGKARGEPVPKIFLNNEMQKAVPTPYSGPKNTAASTLIACCTGKHFAAPTGITLPVRFLICYIKRKNTNRRICV